MKNLSLIIFSILICCLFLVSCTDKQRKDDIDLDKIDIKINTVRLEKELFGVQPDSLQVLHESLANKYGAFYKYYIENVLSIGQVSHPSVGYSLKSFVTDKNIKELYGFTIKSFSDINNINAELTNGFKRVKHYFPRMTIPDVFTYISGFQYAVIVTDSALGIGLDMYLGKNFPHYTGLGFPMYKVAKMEGAYIPADAIKAWLLTEFEMEASEKNLLSHIIYYGKIMYVLDGLLPEVADTLKMGFTEKQLTWCEKNEFNIWAHFVDNRLLYSTDNKSIIAYMNEGPFTTGLPKESPAQIGVWLGRQIVRVYMEKNQKVTLSELMTNAKPQDILFRSKYKPGR